jgi:hypothetical protein
MKYFAFLAATSAMEIMQESDYKFMQFVVEHGKSYGTKEEYSFRADIFKKNLAFVNEHNAKPN